MAMKITHAAFGDIEFDPKHELNEWETEIEWSGHPIRVDLTFDGATISSGVLDGLAWFVTDPAAFDELARRGLRQDLDRKGSAVKDYMDHHLDDLDAADLAQIFGAGSSRSVDAETFLRGMRLARIGLYPDEPESHAVLDYTLGEELTDYVLTVTLDNRQKIAGIAMES